MIRKLFLVLAAALFTGGCVSYGVYQTPETVEPGTTETGFGIMLGHVPDRSEDDAFIYPIEVAAVVRHGLADNLDIGGRGWFMPLGAFEDQAGVIGLYTDIRYRFIDGPVMLTGSVGVSAMRYGEYLTLGAYPALIAGTKRYYGGVRLIFFTVRQAGTDDEKPQFTTPDEPTIGITTGASFGTRWIVRPELSVYFQERFTSIMVTPGVSLQYRWGD
jgi:hypothetical protein